VPIALVAVHFIIAALAPLGARVLDRRIFMVGALAPLATVVWAVTIARTVLAGEAVTGSVDWLPATGLAVSYRVDAFALVMVALVSGIGTLIFLYSVWYFGHSDDSPRDIGRFASRLIAFAGAMLGLVLVDNLLVLYVFWELTSITSYLLIGYEDRKGSARAAALQAILVTGAGGLAMLAGFVLLGQAAGTYEMSALLANPPRTSAAAIGALLTLAGAFTKSAQVPFHTWLPGAMAAPTPVSAYLHSATMVKAGVYLIARFAPAFAVVGGWRPLVIGFGLATMLLGGLRALRQNDLKLLLAYGTVSQLGFMMTLFGAGFGETTHAAVVLLLAHAMFKASLFLVAGIVDHQTHTRDIRRLSGVGRRMPALAVTASVAALSMAGLPPLFGFIAKESAYEAYLHAGLPSPWPALVLAGLVAGSALTVAYSFRFVWGAFAAKPMARQRKQVGAAAAPPPAGFLAPPALLMALGMATGIQPISVDGLVNAASRALIEVEEIHLALWHGVSVPLGLSVVTIALGAALIQARGPLAELQERYGGWAGAQDAYEQSIKGINVIADRLTGVVQNGSLPVYLAVITLTAVLLPGSELLNLPGLPQPSALAEDAVQTVVAAGIIVAAIAITFSRRRLASVLLLGAVGYGVAVLFVLQGAPDLALTQFLIETLSVVVFVLVLRFLPPTYRESRARLRVATRLVTAAAVGVFVFVFALAAGGSRPDSFVPVSREFLARSVEEAGGHNVVNVILVDFRGYDTLGEITVLAVAGLGVAALVLASLRDQGVGWEGRTLTGRAGEDSAARADDAREGIRSQGHARVDVER
jgi:multicomponent Na+:H+ antiporter subunit A